MPSSDDPIFAVIAAHQTAIEVWQATPDDLQHEEARADALDREQEAFFRVFTVMPTTAAGVAQWLVWLASPEHPDGASRIAMIGEYCDIGFHADVVQQVRAAAVVLTGEARSETA